jgi:hypothetical protein
MLLMLTLSTTTAWGVDDGIYYIRNNGTNKGYLWPSLTTNTTTGYRYLTTSLDISVDAVNTNGVSYPAHDKSYSHWVVKNVTGGYIQLINPRLNKYVVVRTFPKANNTKVNQYGDRDVWLTDEPATEDIEYTYFVLNNTSSPYKISPKPGLNSVNPTSGYSFNSAAGDDREWLTWSGTGSSNKPQTGESREGLIQLYSGGTPLWSFTSDLLDKPTINYDDANSIVTVTDANGLPDGYNVRYTISYDGNDPEDPTASSTIMTDGELQITQNCIIKAVVERYGVKLTEVERRSLVPPVPDAPTFTVNCDNTLEISTNISTAHIYYTISAAAGTPVEPNNSTGTSYDGPLTLADGIKVKAIAYNSTETLSSAVTDYTFHISYTEAPTITGGSPTITIEGPAGSTIYYTTNGVDPVIGASGVESGSSPLAIPFDGTASLEIKAIAKTESLGPSCVTVFRTLSRPTITITADDCDGESPRGNILTLTGEDDGRTYWFTTTAGEGSAAPDINASPNPYRQYTAPVALDDLSGSNTHYTIHAYAKAPGGAYKSSIASQSHQMKTGGKPTLTPPTGSNPNLTINGGATGDKAICTSDQGTPDDTSDDLASEVNIINGTATFAIPSNATGTLTVTIKRGGIWLPSCGATYTLPDAPDAPTWSQSDDNKLSLECATEMAVIHYTIDGTEPTLESPTYTPGCLDDIAVGTRIRAKAYLGFRESAELDYTYALTHVAAPTFSVSGTQVTINCATAGATIYYTTSTDGSEPADPTVTNENKYNGPFTLTGETKIKAIAVKDGLENSSIVSIVLQEGYSITSASDLSKLSTYPGQHFYILSDIDASGFTTVSSFTGVIEGNYHTISNLSVPLINNANGAIIHDLMLKDVGISIETDDTNVGAFVQNAAGTTRIYNCGILGEGSSVSGTKYVGGMVGQLDGEARVINCFSYATIGGGTHRGGIVGYNTTATTSGNRKTMVMNCMFYGDISTASGYEQIAPIYGGEIIHNKNAGTNNTGLNNYNYFLYKDQGYLGSINTYNGALGAEERFLNRFEFFRLTLNSTHYLAAYYVNYANPQKDLIAKWVLDKKIAPYPILKKQGYYPSIFNPDDENAVAIDADNAHRNEGRKLGTLTVNISGVGSGTQFSAPTEASITKNSLTLNITDKDPDNYNFNYKKIQLPYYSQVGTGNYTKASDTDETGRVVTGWKITSIIGGTQGEFTNTGTDAPAFNFVDRACTDKDLYSVSKRVFNQGAYWEVPDGVTEITIEPYWAKAVFLSDAYYDVTYKTTTKTDVKVAGTCPTDINGISVNNSVSAAMTALGSNSEHTVYDYAVVLVGNFHQYATNAIVSDGNPVTFMSADLDGDCEPDNTLFYYHNSRRAVSPIRFDFLNMPGIGSVKRTWDSDMNPQVGIFQPKGWFEVTNTVFVRFGQFEYSQKSIKTIVSPCILQGGIYEQFVSTHTGDAANTDYLHIGGNAWFHEFNNGCHTRATLKTPAIPINVSGGDFEKFYLSGVYQPEVNNGNQNAECYIDGGRFGELAGAGMQQIKGNVTWLINGADITSFYGGGINDVKEITGNISTTISNSYVDEFYGGPKFGNMHTGTTVTTEATDCHFGLFHGAGYGGTSLNKVGCEDVSAKTDTPPWSTYISEHYSQNYETTHHSNNGSGSDVTVNAISTGYEYEYILHSDGEQTVARLYVNFASLSLASTKNVEASLKGCTIGTFYGGGHLGAVYGNINSTLTDCTVTGNAFGAGFSADAPTVDVMQKENFPEGKAPVYNRTAGVFNDHQVQYPETRQYLWKHADAVGTDNWSSVEGSIRYIHTTVSLDNLGLVSGNTTLTLNGKTRVTGNVYGGGNESALTGSIYVNIAGNCRVNGDVYGGGALANTNTDYYKTEDANLTVGSTVNLLGGTVGGDVYGGGQGRLGGQGSAAVAALVGNAKVNLNGLEAGDYVPAVHATLVTPMDDDEDGNTDYYLVPGIGCVVNRIFGCNNINGTPKGDAKVHVFKTQGDGSHTRTSAEDLDDIDDDNHSYEVEAVYGGGNLAAYEPADADNKKASVIIDGCDRTSIKTVYGGGNAASTPATCVEVFGTYEIEEVFGGGNGYGEIRKQNEVIPNPGANVGFYEYADDDPEAATATLRADNFGYGSGEANVKMYGGRVHRVFGGSNTKGNVRIIAVTMMDDMVGCDLIVDQAYGGGKSAPMDGAAKLLMACVPNLRVAYGGAQDADIHNDVILNITNGNFDRVFGGNNVAGTIGGTITVNIEETGCTPIIIGQLYGGGNQAAYTAPNGQSGPTINARSFTSIGEIYGGGYGKTATVTGDTHININVYEGIYAEEDQHGYDNVLPETNRTISFTEFVRTASGGYEMNTDGSRKTQPVSYTVHIPAHEKGSIGSIGNIYGGGNEAALVGNTNVKIGTEKYVPVATNITVGETDVSNFYTRSGDGTTTPYTYTKVPAGSKAAPDTDYFALVKGADIIGNVYGGGNKANVSGNTNVEIGKKE